MPAGSLPAAHACIMWLELRQSLLKHWLAAVLQDALCVALAQAFMLLTASNMMRAGLRAYERACGPRHFCHPRRTEAMTARTTLPWSRKRC